MRLIGLAILCLCGGLSFAKADDASTIYPFDGSFEDATFLVERAIID